MDINFDAATNFFDEEPIEQDFFDEEPIEQDFFEEDEQDTLLEYFVPEGPNRFLNEFLRVYINTAYPSVSYISVFGRSHNGEATLYDTIRRYLTDPASLLVQLFVPEWIARAAHVFETVAGEKPRCVDGKVDLLHCLGPGRQESQRPDLLKVTKHDGVRIFWLPADLPNDGLREEMGIANWDTTPLAELKVGVCVANGDGPLAETSPFNQLFKTSGLPFLPEIVAAPKNYYELEKTIRDSYRLKRKEHSDARFHGENRLELPPEMWRHILHLVAAMEDKMELIPTILCMRLINRAWNEIATSLYHNAETFLVSELFGYPIAFRPYLRRLRLYDRKLRDGIPVRYPPPSSFLYDIGSYEISKYPSTLEDSIIDILATSPNLEEITFANPFHPFNDEIEVYVVGWRREALGSDVLEPVLVAQLDCHLRQLEMLAAKATTIVASTTQQAEAYPDLGSCYGAIADVLFKFPKNFHCLGPPGDALLLSLGRHLTFKDLHFTMIQEFGIFVNFEFSIGGNWGIDEAVKWFKEGRFWEQGGWPETAVLVVHWWSEEDVATERHKCLGYLYRQLGSIVWRIEDQ